ncbi:MAG: hypothetical protein HFJ45_01110 [Clostridia bacterium]|nr:hypothetical protein [Clostridia bacterium]
MSDSLITIVAIFLAAILMFIFPLMSIAERSDDIAELTVQTAVTSFVSTARSTGKITLDDYNKMMNKLNATGNSYDVEIEVKVLDENVGKKSAWTQGQVIGENIYYSVYTSQIMNYMTSNTGEGDGVYTMKEGDIISVSAKNNNKTLSQTIRSVFYSISGNGTYQIAAQASGLVAANGTNTR